MCHGFIRPPAIHQLVVDATQYHYSTTQSPILPVQFPENLKIPLGIHSCSRLAFLFDRHHLRVFTTNTMNVSTKKRTDVTSSATSVDPSISDGSSMCWPGSRRWSVSTAVPLAGGHVVETIISWCCTCGGVSVLINVASLIIS